MLGKLWWFIYMYFQFDSGMICDEVCALLQIITKFVIFWCGIATQMGFACSMVRWKLGSFWGVVLWKQCWGAWWQVCFFDYVGWKLNSTEVQHKEIRDDSNYITINFQSFDCWDAWGGLRSSFILACLQNVFNFTRQFFTCGSLQEADVTYGRVLGGSSCVNAMMWSIGSRHDYDHWEKLGNQGWSYADVLPYFKKIENIKTPSHVDRGQAFRNLCKLCLFREICDCVALESWALSWKCGVWCMCAWVMPLTPGVTCPIDLHARLTCVDGVWLVEPCPIDMVCFPGGKTQPPKCSLVDPHLSQQYLLPPPLPLEQEHFLHQLKVLVLQGFFYAPSTIQEKVLQFCILLQDISIVSLAKVYVTFHSLNRIRL